MKTASKISLTILAAAGLAATAVAAADWGGRGGPGRGPERGAMLFQTFDADGDGVIGLEEARGVQADRLARFDADGDGTLSLAEFEALHAEITRPRMVDAFQRLDADGDGAVTAAEMAAPVDRIGRRMDVDGDGDIDRDDLAARGPRGDRPGR